MNVRKIVICTTIIFVGYNYAASNDTEAVIRAITGAHTRLFSVDDLYKKRLDAADVNEWNKVLGEIRNFVNKNGSEYISYFNSLSGASDDLINGIKLIYNTKTNKAQIQNQINILQRAKEKVIAAENALDRESSKLKGKILTSAATKKTKQNVLDILGRLALTLELTTNKAINDARKLQ